MAFLLMGVPKVKITYLQLFPICNVIFQLSNKALHLWFFLIVNLFNSIMGKGPLFST